MNNITLALDYDTYRLVRIAAARRNASVSFLVKQYLHTLAPTEAATAKPAPELVALLAEIASRHPNFSCRDKLSREDLYKSRR